MIKEKQEKKKSKTEVSLDIQNLLKIGDKMSNLLFNLKQVKTMDSKFSIPAAELQLEWDRLYLIYSKYNT